MKFDDDDLISNGYVGYVNDNNNHVYYEKSFSKVFEHAEDAEERPYRGFIIVIDKFSTELMPFNASARFMTKSNIYFNVEMDFCDCHTLDEIERFFYDVFERMDCTLF